MSSTRSTRATATRCSSSTPELGRELWVAGRPAWQVLAGAGRAAYDAGRVVQATVRYDDAPYGVGYAVVDWELAPA